MIPMYSLGFIRIESDIETTKIDKNVIQSLFSVQLFIWHLT